MLKIGFEAKRVFQNYTGLGNYSRTFIQNLLTNYPENIYYLFSPTIQDNARTKFLFNNPNVKLITPESKFAPGWRSFGQKYTKEFRDVDVYHGLSHEIPFFCHMGKQKIVVTIHDLIFKIFPKQYKRHDVLIYNYKFKYACENSHKIVAISECTKNDIIKYYNIPASKISVIYQSCDESFFLPCSQELKEATRRKYNLPSEYFLYVGSIIERKNLHRVIEALYQLPTSLRAPLVCIGEGDEYKKLVLSLIHKYSLQNHVIFASKVEFSDLAAIYQGSLVSIYPSLYEGFGIPIIEAQAGGVPVITSNVSCLPEAAGSHSLLVDPLNSEEIAQAMRTVLESTELRLKMGAIGKEYVKKFNKNMLTAQMMELYLSLTNQ